MTKLNLGCGAHPMPGWINYDADFHVGVTTLDLSRGTLPHGDNSVDYIFTEHFIEHISKENGLSLLRDCFRVLTSNGVLRISTPDLSYVIYHYSKGRTYHIPGSWEPKSPCDMVNEGMRLWGHQYLYDKDEIVTSLIAAGFKGIWECKKGVSVHEALKNVEIRPHHLEMYIEATKSAIRE